MSSGKRVIAQIARYLDNFKFPIDWGQSLGSDVAVGSRRAVDWLIGGNSTALVI